MIQQIPILVIIVLSLSSVSNDRKCVFFQECIYSSPVQISICIFSSGLID